MASFLTLVSRYLGKKKKFVEKQKETAEKEKKKKAKQFAADYPSHDKQLKSWEKTYGEKKQKADAKFEDERKRRVMKARAMGPALRKKKYRSASVYMAKDPFTQPPKTPKAKQTYLTKKGKKKNDFITKINAPIKGDLLKENNQFPNSAEGAISAYHDLVHKTYHAKDKSSYKISSTGSHSWLVSNTAKRFSAVVYPQGVSAHNGRTDDADFEEVDHDRAMKLHKEQLKENIKMAMPPLRNISQSLIEAVIEAQKKQPASIDKPLDISLKGIDTKQPVKEAHPSDAHFVKQQIEGHRKAAAKAKAAGDHHTAMAHEQQARDYEQHGMHGSKWETSSGLKYEEVNMDTVTEGAKKIKLTPGMKSKDFKAQKTAMKQKVVAKAKKAAAKKKAVPSMPKVSSAPAAKPEEEDDKMLSRLLKGKLKHGDHPHLAKAIVSKIRTTHVKDRAEMQRKIYNAKGDELQSLIR